MNELEELEKIKELCTCQNGVMTDKDIIVLNLIDKVKTGLTRLKKLEKVINIFKHKQINIFAILDTQCAWEYNMRLKLNKLTEEEFNLLKEVFGR